MSPVLAGTHPSAVDLHRATLVLLQATNVTVYSGAVPDGPPSDSSGKVYPYAVLWGSPGSHPDWEASSLCDEDDGALAWEARVTVAAGEPTWALEAAINVRQALSRARPLPRSGLLREPEGSAPQVQKDPDAKPVRWFVPLVFVTMSA